MIIDFEKSNGLVPAIIQDALNNRVLMLGYMNAEALAQTKAEGMVTFYSRSRKALWTKGATSGNYLEVVDITVDCDQDTLLIKVKPLGPACHTGATTCFKEESSKGFLYQLENTIASRITTGSPDSYTRKLYQSGINKMAQKVGEEALELVIESKDDDAALFRNEAADLLYHFLILLQAKGHDLEAIEQVLQERHLKSKG